jgi:hypothetical protein
MIIAVTGKIAVTQIIGDDEDNVGRGFDLGGNRKTVVKEYEAGK